MKKNSYLYEYLEFGRIVENGENPIVSHICVKMPKGLSQCEVEQPPDEEIMDFINCYPSWSPVGYLTPAAYERRQEEILNAVK
jgi:hypothetical protein